MRIEPHQGKFCEKIGISRNRQSFLENGDREIRAEYLDLIAGVGLDISYIITGQRGADLLGKLDSALLIAVEALDDAAKEALLLVVRRMRSDTHFTPQETIDAIASAVHSPGKDFRGEEQ